MMDALMLHVLAWPALGAAILVFGFAPGAALRVIVLFYRRDHPRRQELLGELYAVPRMERPFWVAEQLEIALFEGLRDRFAARRPTASGHRGLGYAVGAALMVLLVGLDAVPLYWAAQAFGLNSASTWLMTLTLVVMSVAAMLGFTMTRHHRWRRGLLVGVVAVAYFALIALRTESLTAWYADSLLAALLQSAILTAISAGLVLCGSAVLARIPPRRASAVGHRRLGYAVGAALMVLLVVLNAVPLYWAAQAFSLDPASTRLVTLTLVVMSVAAMHGFTLTRHHQRRRGLLVGVVAATYLALLVLCAQFLATMDENSFLVVLPLPAILTAASAGLVLCGSAVLARIPPRPASAAGHRRLGYAVGAALMVLVVALGAVPLYWAAQAYAFNPAGTWLATATLVVTSVAAVLGFTLTRHHWRRRGLLVGVVAAAYLAMLALRTQFLTTWYSDSLPAALLQSAILTAGSAGLVLCGSAMLARIPPRPAPGVSLGSRAVTDMTAGLDAAPT